MNPMDMLKDLGKLQQTLKESQEKLAGIQVIGTAGGDMVSVTMNGTAEIQKVSIAPEAVDTSDIEMLEDLILAACRDANSKLKDRLAQEVGSMGLPLQGMFGA
jgi:DNA-binding YbaB/EbfC family protein